ncbi:MAG: hypothetical protein Q7J80_07370 [Anaerolineales bacterium]|nr:hypothetical protein [Anaerolineales bacterium]
MSSSTDFVTPPKNSGAGGCRLGEGESTREGGEGKDEFRRMKDEWNAGGWSMARGFGQRTASRNGLTNGSGCPLWEGRKKKDEGRRMNGAREIYLTCSSERVRIELTSDYSTHGKPHPTTRETLTPVLQTLARVSRPRRRSLFMIITNLFAIT